MIGDRHRLAEGPAKTEHRAGDHARAAVRQDRLADHLPAGRAEGERRLLVQPRRLQEHLARDRRDDRQDHHGQHDADGQHRCDRTVDAGSGEERDEPEVVLAGTGTRCGQERGEHRDPPETVHDARDRCEQVHEGAERRASLPGA